MHTKILTPVHEMTGCTVQSGKQTFPASTAGFITGITGKTLTNAPMHSKIGKKTGGGTI
ncbi:MAG: hypothetical protein LBH00_07940 [Planctomycetaceae bacterium]|jgi:hypothetical protein|nr:hypothetical protein [Planctomycetaceae bacterium]